MTIPLEDRVSIYLPEAIDAAGEQNSGGTWAIANQGGEWKTLNFGGLARSVNLVAWWIDENFGPGTGSETLGFMGYAYSFLVVSQYRA